MSPSHN